MGDRAARPGAQPGVHCLETDTERLVCYRSVKRRGQAWNRYVVAHRGRTESGRPKRLPTIVNEHVERQRLKHALKRLYKMSLEQYDGMARAQGGVCLICQQFPEDGKRLQVDHDHSTGEVRSLLCHRCNVLVGFIEHAHPLAIERARDYVAFWRLRIG